MRELISFALAGMLALSAALPTNWGVEGGDNNRSGHIGDVFKPPLMIATSSSGAKLIKKLGKDEEDTVYAPPVITDGKIFVGSLNGRLHCIDIDTFEEDWHIDRDNITKRREVYRSAACVDGDSVYIGDMLGFMTCYSVSGQKVLWQKKFPQWILSSPIVDEGLLIFGTDDEYVRALNKETGNEVWKSEQLAGPANNGIVQNGDLFYIGCWGTKKGQVGNLECISKKTGKKAWTNPTNTGGAISSTPTCSNEFVFVASTYLENGITKGKLTCVSASGEDNGYKYWQSEDSQLINAIRSSPVISPDGTKAIIGCRDKSIYCYEASTGNLLWQTKGFSHINSSGIVSDNYCYIGSQDGYLNVLDINAEGDQSGTVMVDSKDFPQRIPIKTTQTTGIGSVGTPAYYDGHLVIINTQGEMVRIDPAPFGCLEVGKNKLRAQSDSQVLNLDIALRNSRTSEEVQPEEPFSGKIIVECSRIVDAQENTLNSSADEPKPITLFSKSFKLSPWDSDLRISRIELDSQLASGNYKLTIKIIDHNAEWIKLTDSGGKTETIKNLQQGDGESVEMGQVNVTYEILLTVDKPLPIMSIANNQITIEEKIYDDEIGDQSKTSGSILIQNVGEGVLSVEMECDSNLLLDSTNLEIEPKGENSVSFWLDPNASLAPGTHKFEITVTDTVNDISETVEVFYEVLRSENTVVVWIGSKNAKVNNELTQLDAPPYIKSGTTMVPLRLVSEGLGFGLEWVPELKTIIIDLGGNRFLRLVIDYPTAIIEEPDGTLTQQELIVAPEISGGRTFVPLRFIGEIVGAEVEWKAETKQVTLTRSLKE